jgi:hypothetical protein
MITHLQTQKDDNLEDNFRETPKEQQACLITQTQFQPWIPPLSPPLVTIVNLNAENYKRQLDTHLTKIKEQLDITCTTNIPATTSKDKEHQDTLITSISKSKVPPMPPPTPPHTLPLPRTVTLPHFNKLGNTLEIN